MKIRVPEAVSLGAVLALCVSCASVYPMQRQRSNAFDYLYPEGISKGTPANGVRLEVPLRVGIAFAPAQGTGEDPFTEEQRQALLGRVADAFGAEEVVARLEVVPSHYLSRRGGFEELERLKAALGIDLIALISYDQKQFAESTDSSWAYLTVVGAVVVQGERNETRTVMDTVVYDIPSRALLFRAAGESTVKGRTTPIRVGRQLRLHSGKGFEEATDSMIANLETSLEAFKEQAKSGTVRGPGTPAVQVVSSSGAASGVGLGAWGHAEVLGLAVLILALALPGRRSGRSHAGDR